MKQKEFEYLVKVNVEMSNAEITQLAAVATLHYDHKCKAAGQEPALGAVRRCTWMEEKAHNLLADHDAKSLLGLDLPTPQTGRQVRPSGWPAFRPLWVHLGRSSGVSQVMMTSEQANTAWKQIPMMTKMACGAREAKVSDGKLVFKVGGKPMRFVEVALNGLDLYDVTHFRIKRGSYERVELESTEGLYNDMLGEAIYHMVNK